MKTCFCFIIAILVCSTFSIKAQSLKINLDSIFSSKQSISDNQVLNSAEKEKWSNKIKPYYNRLKPNSIIVNNKDSLRKLSVDIDEKMCLLIPKDIFVDTDFRMPKSSENIDLKMVYPRKKPIIMNHH